MKTQLSRILTGLVLVSPLLLCGCGAKKAKMDTTTFDKAFQTAPAEVQALAAKAAKVLKQGKLEEGANALADVARKGGLTEEQKDGIRDVITRIQTIMAEDAEKSDIKVYQACEVVMAVLEGRPPMRVGVNPSSLDKPN